MSDEGDTACASGADVGPEERIADRYRLVKPLGRGSFGEVWEAHDGITGKPVAVKLLFSHVELAPARAQLEVIALRQRLPGVAALRDDGVHEGRAFLVMDLIEGRPFPGEPGLRAWDEIAGVTVALLETLARVHSAFIVHRDLKPENVLVTRSGDVRLLDFGIAYQQGAASADAEIDAGHLLGTATYMAPEQIQARPVTERSDLYALGVMLYQALAGRPPHDDSSAARLLFMKVNRRPSPLREVAPRVPEAVAGLVDRMLSIKPRERPATAFEVLSTLRGERSVQETLFPWIGPQTTIARVIAAARQGLSVDIVGPAGSGRTRHLLAVEQTLSGARKVIWARPATPANPPSSEGLVEGLAALPGEGGSAVSTSLEEARAAVERRLRGALEGGAVLLVDDASHIDQLSFAVISRARGAGVVIRALDTPDGDDPSAVRLLPLSEEDLRSLFAGPDRLLHLREDAAKILFERTGGVPARVVLELSTWMDLGIARRVRNLVAVSRETLDRLARGLFASAPAPARPGRSPEPASAADWAALARDAAAEATRLIDEGHLGEAAAVIEAGLRMTRALPEGNEIETSNLLALWLEAAFEDGAPQALDRALYALCRARPQTAAVRQLESLGRAIAAEDVRGRALEILLKVPRFADPRLERVRLGAFAAAARKLEDDAMEARLIDEVSRSPAAADVELAARLHHWRGRVMYLRGAYRQAALLHRTAAAQAVSVPLRISATSAAAYSLLEAFELDEARALADEARALAAQHRHASQEAAAEWTLRTIAYRSGTAEAPDMDLIEAMPYAAGRQFQGAVLFTEAAVAWRSGRLDEARALARRGHETLAEIRADRGALLLHAFLIALGEPSSPPEIADICRHARDSTVPGIGIQALALLALGGKLPAESGSEVEAARLSALVPRPFWHVRCDILSIEECLAAIKAPSTEGGRS